MRVLVSFLGLARKLGGYRKVAYRFENETWPETSYFGLALARRLQTERLVLMGTRASMWDQLLADHLGAEELTEAHLGLCAAAQEGTVSLAQLTGLQPLIERVLGCPVTFELIGEACSAEEQIAILDRLAGVVAAGDEVTLDVTHGYRHLPMLALAAAAYLEKLRGVAVHGIYYAAAEMPGAPVINLRGLLDLLEWVEALAAYRASGNLAALAAPLQHAGMSPGALNDLAQAAFDERNQNTERAVPKLGATRRRIQGLASPVLALFRDQLEHELDWINSNERWRHEARLAGRQLDRGDWLRAAILFTEAVISRHLGPRAGDRAAREAAGDGDLGAAFVELKDIRNALAHGNPSRDSARRDQIARLVGSREDLPCRLRELAAALGLLEDASLPTRAGGAG